MPKPRSTNEMLKLLERSDSSEAHAIMSCIQDALEDVADAGAKKETAIGMLEEFNLWSKWALKEMNPNYNGVANAR